MDRIYEQIKRAQSGDSAAKEELLQENSGLIWSVVKRFHGRGEMDDLYQIGAIGLLKCIENFDTTYDVKFSTYAVPMIMGEIKRFLRDDGTIKVSRRLKALSYRIKKAQDQALKEYNKELTIAELAEYLEETKEEITLAMEAAKEVESLYTIRGEENADRSEKLIDRIGDTLENDKWIEKLSLKEAIGRLDAKERQIIFMRYFQDRTQMDVAKTIGISQVQVSRIEKRILRQMKIILQ